MTVERMVSLFEASQKDLQQTQLGMNLIAVCCQRLASAAKQRPRAGRRDHDEHAHRPQIHSRRRVEKLKGTVGNREAGCQSFDQHLTELFQKQIIDVAEARRLATNPDALNLALRGISNSDNRLR